MPSFDTYAEIKVDILDRAEEETGEDESEFFDFVDRAADRAYHDLLGRRPWLFARPRRPLILQAAAPITTTITWTAALYTATLGAVQARALGGWRALPTGETVPFRIVAHIPGTAGITLEAPRQGATLAAGTVVTLFRDEYDLAEIQDAPTAPTAALAGTGVGLVDNGAHTYRVTFAAANGETEAGAAGTVTVVNNAANGKVALSAIPTGPPGTYSRKVYRSKAATTAPLYLLTTLENNTATTYTDNTADSSLPDTPLAPDRNTTSAVRHIVGIWPMDQPTSQVEGPLSEERLREEYSTPRPCWPPSAYARVADDLIRLSDYPSQAGLLEVAYTRIPRDLSLSRGPHDIVVPRDWRWGLVDGGLFWLYQLKHDDRAATVGARWEKFIEDLAADDERKKSGVEGSRTRARREAPGR